MIEHMRTTILLDDRLGATARKRAKSRGISFSALVARSLEEHLARPAAATGSAPFRLVTVGGGGPKPGIDLDRTSDLLAAEDEAQFKPRRGTT